jgi:hypothetical protein
MQYINKINKSEQPLTIWTYIWFVAIIGGVALRWTQVNDWTLNIVTGELAVTGFIAWAIYNRLGRGFKNHMIRLQEQCLDAADALIEHQQTFIDGVIEAVEQEIGADR